MRIALLADNYPLGSAVGGIGTYSRVLGRRLAELGHDVHVFAFGPAGQRLDGGLVVHLLDPWGGRRDLGIRSAVAFTRQRLTAQDLNAFQLADAVRREVKRNGSFDVLESPEFGGLGRFLVGQRSYVRTLAVRLHGPATAFSPEGRQVWDDPANDPERALALAADVITAPTNAAIELCRQAWGVPLDVTVIGNPVESFAVSPQVRRGADVFFVGRLERRKGIDVLADVLELVGRPLDVRLAGEDCEWLPGIRATQMMQNRGLRFKHLGVIPPESVRMELTTARVVVVPSRSESFGLTLVEAMMCGAPTIASEIPPFREISRSGSALLLPLEDREAWAKAIEDLLSDRMAAAELGRKGRERAKEFSVDLIAARLLDAWQVG